MSAPAGSRIRARLASGAKVAVTLALVAWLLGRVDWSSAFARMGTLSPTAGVAALALVALQLVLLGLRWRRVNRVLGVRLDLVPTLRLTWIGHFFNQVLPSGFAGDAVRAWLAVRTGVALGLAVRSVLCDRFLGLLALVALIACTTLVMPLPEHRALPGRDGFQLVAVAALAGLVVLSFAGEPLARLVARWQRARPLATLLCDLRRVVVSRAAIVTLALAMLAHALGAFAIAVAAAGMDVPLGPAAALFVVPAVLLVAMAPVSVAGWGVREGAMIVGLGFVGVAATDALALSLTFGLLQVATGLVGGAAWLGGGDRGEIRDVVRSRARSRGPDASAVPPLP